MNPIDNHISKVEKYLGWCDKTYEKLIQFSQPESKDDLEREFITLLGYIQTIHESLRYIGKQKIDSLWAEKFDNLRKEDELLYYFWQARNKNTHDSLISWRHSLASLSVKVIDPVSYNNVISPFFFNKYLAVRQLYCFLYDAKNFQDLINKMESGASPKEEKLKVAGVEIHEDPRRTFALDEFKVSINRKLKTVKAPNSHLGKICVPSANYASKCIIEFYKSKWTEIQEYDLS